MMKEANKIYQQHSSLAQDPDLVFEALDHLDSIDYLKEWNKLKKNTGPLLVIASSGMLTGGRIHRYLENWYDDKRAILFLPGYQGEGTLGRAMVEGKRSFVTAHDEQLTWSGEVWTTDAFSSHADQNELIKWLGEQNKSGQIYLIHGELKSKRALKHKLEELGFLHVEIPLRGSTF
jgi:metallo-beta-lactamase family protein